METLLREMLPHAPQSGLYIAPDIPRSKLKNAVRDYAQSIRDKSTILALYDNTLMKSAKDGMLFLADRLIYQNNNLTPGQEIRYDDIVGVKVKRKLLGGREIHLSINRARATIEHTMDCSAHPESADFIARFLEEALFYAATESPSARPAVSDQAAVRAALEPLRASGQLTDTDYERLMAVLETSA